MAAAIIVEGLGKKFLHRDAHRPRTVRRFIEGGWRASRGKHDFWALRDVSFAVEPGEMLGVVGSNGSGKSTLLRILGGVMRPSEGAVRTAHAVNGLLDLGAGMHPDLTGRENAICSGVLAGLTRREIEARMDDVIEFAELAEFVDEPLRSYSAGMKLRLGFAVAAQTRPRILLIDEVLAVGDLAFQHKCLDRIDRFRRDGCAIVLISHDLVQVEAHCDRTLWLDNGSVKALGATHGVARHYEMDMIHRWQGGAKPYNPSEDRAGELDDRIKAVRLLDRDGMETDTIAWGDPLAVEVSVETATPMSELMFSITLANEKGADLIDVTTEFAPLSLPDKPGASVLRLDWDRLELAAGSYWVNMGLYAPGFAYAHDRRVKAFRLTVEGRESWCSVVPPYRWSVG